MTFGVKPPHHCYIRTHLCCFISDACHHSADEHDFEDAELSAEVYEGHAAWGDEGGGVEDEGVPESVDEQAAEEREDDVGVAACGVEEVVELWVAVEERFVGEHVAGEVVGEVEGVSEWDEDAAEDWEDEPAFADCLLCALRGGGEFLKLDLVWFCIVCGSIVRFIHLFQS